MTALDLMRSYSKCNSAKEMIEQERRIQDNQKEFLQGVNFALRIYSLYSLFWLVGRSKAVFAETPPAPNGPEPNEIAPAPFRLNDGQKGLFTSFGLGMVVDALVILGSSVIEARSPGPTPIAY